MIMIPTSADERQLLRLIAGANTSGEAVHDLHW